MSKQTGLSLLEMLISLAISMGLIVALVGLLVRGISGQQMQSQLQLRQENGRYFLSRIRHDIQHTGYYQRNTIAQTQGVDLDLEAAFVASHPIILPSDVPFDLTLGTKAQSNGSDELVVAFQNDRDCRGFKLGYSNDETFFVVNRYFVEDFTLYCIGFDGRVLRQQKNAQGHNRHSRAALLEQVYRFNVRFMLMNPALEITSQEPNQTRFVDPEALNRHPEWISLIRAVQVGCVLRTQLPRDSNMPQNLFFMGEPITLPDDEYRYVSFETFMTLPNLNTQPLTINLSEL